MLTTAGNCLRIFHSHTLRSRSRHRFFYEPCVRPPLLSSPRTRASSRFPPSRFRENRRLLRRLPFPGQLLPGWPWSDKREYVVLRCLYPPGKIMLDMLKTYGDQSELADQTSSPVKNNSTLHKSCPARSLYSLKVRTAAIDF